MAATKAFTLRLASSPRLVNHRLITAAIGIPLLAGVVWVGGPLLAAVVALAVFVALIEFAMARGAQRNHVAIAGALCGAALPALALAGDGVRARRRCRDIGSSRRPLR